jgi:hypothetical protein
LDQDPDLTGEWPGVPTAGVRRIIEQPLDGLRVNLHGTENVLEAALVADATVVPASTSEVYGKNTADKLSENADRILGSPLVSRHPRGVSVSCRGFRSTRCQTSSTCSCCRICSDGADCQRQLRSDIGVPLLSAGH